MQLKPDTLLQNGKYRIIRDLGQGGFGITYLALHTMLDKQVAIKEFFPKEYCDRNKDTNYLTVNSTNSLQIVDLLKNKFIKEARNISKLNHSNIITIHDIFEEGNTAYYVMEYVEGHSLSELIKVNGRIPEGIALKYIKQIAGAIDYMHSLSMNHLDIKPANIMVREEDDEPILIDFGLSKQYDASGGQTSTTPVGISHGFAPAEQYRPGGVSTFTPQTDIYALGATLFNLLSGTIPPHYSEILEDGLPALPDTVSSQTAKAIEYAMEVRKNRRPSSIQQFLNAFSKESLISNSDNKLSGRVSPENNSKTIEPEETTLLSSPNQSYIQEIQNSNLLHNTLIKRNIPIGKDITIDGLKFVDLGLSVKWATQNLGAYSVVSPGTYFEKGENLEVSDWNMKGAKVPTSQQFQELIDRCDWEWIDQNGFYGYKITGPNGNAILLQVTGEGSMKSQDLNKAQYGILWTNEALYKEATGSTKIFYFNPYTHRLTSYPSYNKRPIRLITE
ncbi:MAG: serine/threonine protein kinase [Bacteroides sp.]|nr:serine/threonine protein kinase [Bacteroides sp.]